MFAAKHKSADAPVDISFVSSWVEKLGALELIAEQKTTLVTELTKLRGVSYQKIKLAK